MKKNKTLPLIIGGLAAIAVGSVGFASWVIGSQQLTSEIAGTKITVDGTTNETLIFNMVAGSDNTIEVAENIGSPEDEMHATGSGDRSITADITIEISAQELAKLSTATITYTLKSTGNYAFLKTTENKVGRVGPGTWDYLNIPVTSSLTFDNESIAKVTNTDVGQDVDGWMVKKVGSASFELKKSEKLTFEWGDYFGGTGPTEFYKAQKSNSGQKDSVYWDNVKVELDTMQKVLQNDSNTIDLTATFANTTAK